MSLAADGVRSMYETYKCSGNLVSKCCDFNFALIASCCRKVVQSSHYQIHQELVCYLHYSSKLLAMSDYKLSASLEEHEDDVSANTFAKKRFLDAQSRIGSRRRFSTSKSSTLGI